MKEFNIGDEVWYDSDQISGAGYGRVIGFDHEPFGKFAIVEFYFHNMANCFIEKDRIVDGKTHHNCRLCSYDFLTHKTI